MNEQAVRPVGIGADAACCELRRGRSASAGGIGGFCGDRFGLDAGRQAHASSLSGSKRVILNCMRQWASVFPPPVGTVRVNWPGAAHSHELAVTLHGRPVSYACMVAGTQDSI